MISNYKIEKYNENFDFFDDEIPETVQLYFRLGDQLERCRSILRNRSREEIEYIIECLDWMLRDSSVIESETSRQLLKNKDTVFINRVKAFKLFSNNYDISEQKSLPNASWSDYFAALSLITILEALHPENYDYALSAIDYSLEALEAVCIAEFKKELEDYESLSAKRKGQAGGKRKASKFEAIINKVLTTYRNTDGLSELSNRKAGYLLSEMLKEDIEASLLNSEEPEQRIAIWLGKYKNGKLKIIE